MSSRALLVGAVGLLVLAAVTGCGPEEPVEQPMRVRLLTASQVSGRWDKAAERGLGRIAAELGAEVARIRALDGASRRRLLDEQGRAGVDLVFCVGSGFADLLFTEAPAYPETRFVKLPGRARGPNVAGITFVLDGAGYLAGSVAAAATDQDMGGVLRGAGGPWLEELERGFAAGFRARRRGARVLTAEGAAGPWELLVAGCSVALYAAEEADREVLAAAHNAGLQLVATEPSLIADQPELVLAAVRIDVAEAMLRVAREVRDETFRGRVYAFDLGSGVLDLELGSIPDVDRRLQLRRAMEQARAEVTAGFVELEQLGLD